MSNRRARTSAFYRVNRADSTLVEKSASAADRYQWRGDAVSDTAVVRVDLNGYSKWVRDRPISQRVQLLDIFFSSAMPVLEPMGGVFFRDEGDCLVCLFSEYFGLYHPALVVSFCQGVVGRRYRVPGLSDELSAKASVAWGPVVYFQKAHEQGTEDWSAEGDPFVRVARLEAAIESKAQVVFYQNDYDQVFVQGAPQEATRGQRYFWAPERRSIQVPGLGLNGGWADIISFEHLAEGRLQT